MQLSYWEIKNWFTAVDFTVVGSGIVGIHCALALRERYPNAKILILEKGTLPQGASTKNAGFACFGSISEIIDDLKTHSEEEVIQLIKKRWEGLQLLRKNIGDDLLDFKPHGGYELFLKEDESLYNECLQKITFVNDLLKPLFKSDVFVKEMDRFDFKGLHEYIVFNPFEAQIDTGNMMQALLRKAAAAGILILNQIEVNQYFENSQHVRVELDNFAFNTQKLLFTTNGFARSLTQNEVQPARAQVLITEPIPDLDIHGTFHLDRGYYYFRNFESRIILGGGRNLDFKGETTTELEITEKIQNRLDKLLNEVILPGKEVQVAHRWSGIMGVGTSKWPIIKRLSEHTYCGVRMGGMGVAIGSLVGKELAEIVA